MAGRGQTFRAEQGGYGIAAGLVAALHPSVGMAVVEQQDGLRQGCTRAIAARLDEDTGSGVIRRSPPARHAG